MGTGGGGVNLRGGVSVTMCCGGRSTTTADNWKSVIWEHHMMGKLSNEQIGKKKCCVREGDQERRTNAVRSLINTLINSPKVQNEFYGNGSL